MKVKLQVLDIIETASKHITAHKADKEVYGDYLTKIYIDTIIAGSKKQLLDLGMNMDQIDLIKWEEL